MNILNAHTHTYILCNVLLLCSFTFFYISTRSLKILALSIHQKPLLRVGQILFLASLVCGFAVSFLPQSIVTTYQVQVIPDFLNRTESLPQTQVTQKSSAFEKETLEVPGPSPKNEINMMDVAWKALFLGCIFLLVVRFLFNYLQLALLIKRSILLKKIGHVSVVISDETTVPFSTRALVTAHVVIPTQLLDSKINFNIAIRHEIQHHRQKDTLWIILMEIMKIPFFWNPSFYLWKCGLEELQELACDETLIKNKKVTEKNYGNCLVTIAENLLPESRTFGIAGMALGKSQTKQSLLKKRTEMIFTYKQSKQYFKTIVTTGTVGLSLLVVAALIGKKSQANSPSSLKVDEAIQKISNEALSKQVKASSAKSGFAIVSDPQNGKILALSYYDGNSKQAVNPSVASDLVLSQVYPPNSLIKPIVAAFALEKGKIKLDDKINCENGLYQVDGHDYHDHTKYGFLSLAEIVAFSSDIGSIKIVEKLGYDGMAQAMSNFGFGQGGSASYLSGAAIGHFPTDYPPGSVARLIPDFSIGRSIYVSPIELVQAYGVIANNGELVKPSIADSEDVKREVIKKVLSPETANSSREMLRKAVVTGWGQKADSGLYPSAGKTGTAYAYAGDRHTYFREFGGAHFIGFAPANAPRILVYVVIQSPEKNAHGGEHAAPVFKEIVEKSLQYLKVAPAKAQS